MRKASDGLPAAQAESYAANSVACSGFAEGKIALDVIDDSADARPLIDQIGPMTDLRKEYENGSASFVAQIDWLISQGFDGIRRARGMCLTGLIQ